MPDINMIIINAYDNASLALYNEFASLVTFPVYQDTPQLGLWERVYGGHKDDFFIFDRCGQETYHIQFPMTYLQYHYTQSALIATYRDSPCYCRLNSRHHQGQQGQRGQRGQRGQQGHGHGQSSSRHHSNSNHQMQGDDPTVQRVPSRSPRCQDLLCRILRRLRRQNRLNLNRNSYSHRHRQH
ncbi:selenoprotein Pb-like [Haliotis rufescens]|uniref:selenoprotein Pb-like n=1 Tax=Haliotis rufescens TaxID=6454 RepID=UPI00201EFCE6|nr:selenoprotein Pb-like [Haliotis rufescens]